MPPPSALWQALPSVSRDSCSSIGKEGLVLETIRPFSAGQVKLDGLEWSAAAADPHMTIESGTAVKVEHIEGVKLIVTPCA